MLSAIMRMLNIVGGLHRRVSGFSIEPRVRVKYEDIKCLGSAKMNIMYGYELLSRFIRGYKICSTKLYISVVLEIYK